MNLFALLDAFDPLPYRAATAKTSHAMGDLYRWWKLGLWWS